MPSDVFEPELRGWMFQRNFPVEPVWNIAEDPTEGGYIKTLAITEREKRRWEGLKWIAETREASGYVRSFFARLVGPVGRFDWACPEPVYAPDAAPVIDAVLGGAQGSRTVGVRYAWRNANGTTLPSPAAALAVPANWLLRVTLPPYPPSVNSAVIYATQTGAAEQEQAVITGGLRIWTQPNAALLLATAGVATVNTATEKVRVKLDGSYRIVRGIGTTYELTLTLQEV